MARIEDYALIGDLQTAALVERGGSIDWLCFPRFDSGACFAALLGDAGARPLAARTRGRRRRRRAATSTTRSCSRRPGRRPTASCASSTSCRRAARRPTSCASSRASRAACAMRSELVIRFDYGDVVPWVRRVGDARLAVAGPDALCFRTPAPTRGENMRTISEFTVEEGERVPFVLTWYPVARGPRRRAIDPEVALAETESFWREWNDALRRSSCRTEWRDVLQRSLMVLKALTYAPTGGIVAAPTTSLPERIGGVRNWDYRYCWLRDATLTLLALLHAGYVDEAREWREWLLRAVAGDPADIQIMYGVAGERRLTEFELPWLPGYEGSAPVRIGNAASEQLQLDVYGEVMDALYQARAHGLAKEQHAWALQQALLELPRAASGASRRGHLGDPRRARGTSCTRR